MAYHCATIYKVDANIEGKLNNEDGSLASKGSYCKLFGESKIYEILQADDIITQESSDFVHFKRVVGLHDEAKECVHIVTNVEVMAELSRILINIL